MYRLPVRILLFFHVAFACAALNAHLRSIATVDMLVLIGSLLAIVRTVQIA